MADQVDGLGAYDHSEDSLWLIAMESLSDTDREILQYHDDEVTPTEVLQTLRGAEAKCEQKQWILYKNKEGDDVKMRDVIGRLCGWVEKFIEVGDAAVEFDPTNYAALPWAVVRSILQMPVNDCQTYGSMLEGVERVSSIITTYTEVEAQLLIRTSVLTRQLAGALGKLYKGTLEFLANACRYFKKKTSTRIAQSIYKKSKTEVQEPLLWIEDQKNEVFRLCMLVNNEFQGNSIGDIKRLLEAQMADSGRNVNKRRQKLLAWVNGTEDKNVFENCEKFRHDGTCNWVLRLDEARAWASDEPAESKLFWLHGPPGFGKTIMSSWIIRHLKDTKKGVVAYFFCLAENQLTQDPYAILRSWLTQLLNQDPEVLQLMVSAFDDTPDREQTLTQSELWKLFLAVGQSGRDYTLVVDGFDECTHVNSGTGYHTKDPRNHFLRDLIEVLPRTRFRVLVVSRDVADIREYLEKLAHPVTGLIKYEYSITADDTGPDVQLFSRHMVKQRLPDGKDELKDTLAVQAASRSAGMFLWVKLLESEISPGKTERELRETISEMPIGVSEAYSKEVEKIRNLRGRARVAAIEILRWVLFAVRPLQVKELAEILAISNEHEELTEYPLDNLPSVWNTSFVDASYVDEAILGRCGSLIELRSSVADAPLANHTVHFVHFSVKEYLLSLEEGNPLAANSGHVDTVAHAKHLSHICLRYLALPIFSEPLTARHAYPFLSYAAWAWYFHSYKPRHDHAIETVDRTKKLFHPQAGSWKVWSPVLERKLDTDSTLRASSNNISSFHEIEDSTEISDIPVPLCEMVQSPMYYASLLGIEEIVHWLEDQGLDCSVPGGRYGFPLQAAVVGNHEDLVKHLIERKVNVLQTGGQYGAAIVAAAARSSLAMVQLLVKADVDLRATDTEGKTALHHAAERGDVAIMTELIQNNADIDAQSDSEMTPLMVASYHEHRSAVKLLVDRGARLELTSADGSTALEMAMPNEDIACDLIAAGIPIDTMNDEGSTPLMLAVSSDECLKTISLLAQRSSNVSIANHEGWTALHLAAYRGSLDAARLLLEAGADVAAITNEGYTVSTVAAACGNAETLQLILDWFKKTKALTDSYPTPLNVAVEEEADNTLKVLLDNGISFQYIEEGSQESAYDVAIRMERFDLALDFAGRGCFKMNDDGLAHKEEASRLALAAFNGDMVRVEETIVALQDCNVAETLFGALCTACSRGFISIAELLIRHGAIVLGKDLNRRTPLHHALLHNHTELANFLIEKGASLTVEDSIGSTPFDLAVTGGRRCLEFIKTHMVVLSRALSRRPSLLEHIHTGDGDGATSSTHVREMLTGHWEGYYKYLAWRKNKEDPFSINIAAGTSFDSLDIPRGFNMEGGEDLSGGFEIFGFVDAIGTVWFVKLYAETGWLYKGQIQGGSGKMKGTWGSNRRLWYGTFHLSKA